MNKRIILVGALFGIIGVILGAFGAHGLEGKVSATSLDNWKTAVSYQFYHTFAILYLSTFSRAKNGLINFSFITFTLGIILFSGSLYLLATREITQLSASFLGPITPLGGLCFILGWIGLFIATIRHK
ncbi:DUF423 domain-containing protein [Albibacterium sp.]|uniref:DUF423 domain-containing protein n=1 Tax=Albibacterium sp. TaxID=2952885 RepID=UPI002B52D5D2|nr:DUF423 domain-containing protein [Albibacterium sp.]HUH17875.1 DUF423 domain-containing protein [Albibacterium sp.]